MTTILTKIKYKGILFENIQGFVSKRHYILPYLISKDKVYQEQLKIYFKRQSIIFRFHE